MSGTNKDLKSGQRDSNPRPRAWEARALPTELCPPKKLLFETQFRNLYSKA